MSMTGPRPVFPFGEPAMFGIDLRVLIVPPLFPEDSRCRGQRQEAMANDMKPDDWFLTRVHFRGSTHPFRHFRNRVVMCGSFENVEVWRDTVINLLELYFD